MMRFTTWAVSLLVLTACAFAADDELLEANPGPVTTRVVDVGDLVQVAAEPGDRAGGETALRNLGELIQDTVAIDWWEENGGIGSIRPALPGSLVIAQHENVHRQIESLLEEMRRPMRTSILLEARFVCAEPGELKDPGAEGAVLGREQWARLLAGQRAVTIASPRAKVANGCAATIAMGNGRRYTARYSALVLESGLVEYRPVTEEIHEGISLWMKASATPERDAVVVTVRPRIQVVRKMETKPWSGWPGAPLLNVEEPLGTQQEIEVTCRLPDGGAAIVGPLTIPKGMSAAAGHEALREGRELYVMVSATVAER